MFVPRSLTVVMRIGALLPRRAVEAVGRAMRTDKILAGADAQARADYERRAAEGWAVEESNLQPWD